MDIEGNSKAHNLRIKKKRERDGVRRRREKKERGKGDREGKGERTEGGESPAPLIQHSTDAFDKGPFELTV